MFRSLVLDLFNSLHFKDEIAQDPSPYKLIKLHKDSNDCTNYYLNKALQLARTEIPAEVYQMGLREILELDYSTYQLLVTEVQEKLSQKEAIANEQLQAAKQATDAAKR